MGSVKLLFIEWLLEINIFIGLSLVNNIARLEIDEYVENNEDIDLRTAPPAVKRGIIHDETILKERWDLCLECEFLTDANRCQKCGCFMKIKHKLKGAACPIGKWNKYEEGELGGVTVTS